LRGDRTVLSLAFTGTACDAIVDGEGSNTLTLTSGMVGGTGSGAVKSVIACDVVLGASSSWTGPDSYLSTVFCYGNVTDNGNGCSMTFAGTQNRSIVFGGRWDIGGPMILNCRTIRMGGVYTNADGVALYGGSITNSPGIYLDGRLNDSGNDTAFTIENTYAADSDRIRGGTALGSLRCGGGVTFFGNAADAVQERVASLDLQSGRLGITVTGRNVSVPTDLIFENVSRVSGTSLGIAASVGGRFIVEGATNTNGIWQPWCFMNGYYAKVIANASITNTVDADYLTAAASANDPNRIYRFNAADLTLEEDTSMWGLRWDRSTAQTLNLGGYDLTIGSGSMIIVGSLDKSITSSGGQLVFAGEDILFDIAGTGACRLSAPLAWSKPAGSSMVRPSLVFSRSQRTDGVILDGEDRIGEYDTLYGNGYYSSAQRTVVLGGPSDRTFYGPVVGHFNLEKRGPGTLTFKGANHRRGGSLNVVEGCVVLAHTNAPAPIVMTNAVCEVAAGIALSSVTVTVQTNATLRGLGTTTTVALQAGARIAPGATNQIGTLTFGTHSTLPTHAVLAIRIGAATNDLLKVNGNLTLPPNGEPINISVSDNSGGAESVKGKSYVVGRWTGTNPGTVPVWNVTTPTPGLLDVSGATVTVVAGNTKQIVLSGLKPAIRGTVVLVL
jgi:hypothetical protein